jgi:hypothetical protein
MFEGLNEDIHGEIIQHLASWDAVSFLQASPHGLYEHARGLIMLMML